MGKKLDPEDKIAVLKRTCMVVITDEWCYWRVAGEEPCEVDRIHCKDVGPLPTMSVLAPGAHSLITSWKESAVEIPDDYDEQLALEAEWVNAVMSKGALPVPTVRTAVTATMPRVALVPMADTPPAEETQPDVHVERPAMDGTYRIYVPRVSSQTTSKRARFSINSVSGRSGREPGFPPSGSVQAEAVRVGPGSASQSSTMVEAVVKQARVSEATSSKDWHAGGDVSQVPITNNPVKQERRSVKREVHVDGSPLRTQRNTVEQLRAELAEAERIQNLRQRVREEEAKLSQMTQGSGLKSEHHGPDDPFRDVDRAFAEDTRTTPYDVDGSTDPVKEEAPSQAAPQLLPAGECIMVDDD